MKKTKLVEILNEADRLLMEEVETDELFDSARAHAHYSIQSAIDYIIENEDDDNY